MKNPHVVKQGQQLEVSFTAPGISKDLGMQQGYVVCPGDEFKPRDGERWLVRVVTVWGRCPEAPKGCMVHPIRRV